MRLYRLCGLLLLAGLVGAPDVGACGEGKPVGTTPEAKNERVDKLFRSMKDGTYDSTMHPRLVWEDIPALIAKADSTTPLKSIPTNMISSYLQRECTEGMAALWLAEGVRKGKRFPSLNPLCLKRGVGKTDWCKASEENHKEAAKAYRAWWDKAKSLKPEKGAEIDPLEGTDLAWY